MIHKQLRHISEDQSGPPCTAPITTSKWRPLSTRGLTLYGISLKTYKNHKDMTPEEWSLIGWPNYQFHSMLKRSRCTAVCKSVHAGDSLAAWTAKQHYHQLRNSIILGPMEVQHEQTRSRSKTPYIWPPPNRGTHGEYQQYIGSIPPGVHQLSTRWLVWFPTTHRVCIQLRISGGHQKHTVVHQQRHQPPIRDDRTPDPWKPNDTWSNDSLTWVMDEWDGDQAIAIKRILWATLKTWSKPRIRWYRIIFAIQCQDHPTIEEIGL